MRSITGRVLPIGLGILLSLIGIRTAAVAGINPPSPLLVSTNPANGHDYALFEIFDFYEARAIATAMNGYLASLPDDAERVWAANAFPSFFDPFIGLTSEAMPGTFAWESGEPLGTTDWALNQPLQIPGPLYARNVQGWETGGPNSAFTALVECEFGIIPVVPTVDTELVGLSVNVSWSAPAGSTATIIRNGLAVATIAAPQSEFLDTPPAGFFNYAVVIDTPNGAQLPGRSAITVPDSAVRLYLEDQSVIRPATATAALFLDQNIGPGNGLSTGICLDFSEVAVTDLDVGRDFEPFLDNASFVSLIPSFSNGIGVGLVYDLFGIDSLPIGTAYEMVTFSVESLTTGTVTTELRPCDEIGSPPITPGVVINGQSVPPLLVSGSVTFQDLLFIRGDCNFDGSIDVADPLFLGLRLFDPTVNDYPCREACEVNGDGSIDIADMITLLGYLFAGGPAPGAPFPDCGVDPEAESAFDCDQGTACP